MTKERIEELIIKASLTRQERNEIREAAVAAGVRVEQPQKGLNIIRMANGQTRKVIIR